MKRLFDLTQVYVYYMGEDIENELSSQKSGLNFKKKWFNFLKECKDTVSSTFHNDRGHLAQR